MAAIFRLLGISGSLRSSSFNSGLIRAARDLVAPEAEFEIFDISAIPLYSEDMYTRGFPPVVTELREKIRASDALVLSTPEYNYSVSGVLKNAIDWASRPPEQPFLDKPIAIMGAASGAFGTARAQYHLRQCFVFLDSRVLSRPEVLVGLAASKFDDRGNLTHEETRDQVAAQMKALIAWVKRLTA